MVAFPFSICPNSAIPAAHFLTSRCVYGRFAAFLQLFTHQPQKGGGSGRITAPLWGDCRAVYVTSQESPLSVPASQVKECAWFVCIPFWKANLLPNFGRASTFGRKGDKKAGCRVVPSNGKQERGVGRLSSHL